MSTVEPSISIITPSFNQGQFIERTIRSVLDQNYLRLEYIVIDGGSTDGTIDILKRYEPRIRWISEKDTGQSNAINKGFQMAKGEIVAWLNSDDTYLPGALAAVGRFFSEHPDVMMVYGEGYIIDETDGIKCRFPFTEPKFDLWKLIYYGDYILQQSSFLRRSVFDAVDLLNESLHYGMDWDLFIRIGKRFRVGYIPKYIGCIREHGLAKTSVGGKERFKELVGIIRRHGVLRYPPAYFNYMWDAYGRKITDEETQRNTISRRRGSLLDVLKRIVRAALSRFTFGFEQGYYGDGWVGKRAMIVIPNFEPDLGDKQLSIAGEVHAPNVPLWLSFRVNRKAVLRHKAKEAGAFALTVPVPVAPKNSDSYHVEIASSRTFVPRHLGINSDPRALGFLLKSIDITRS